MPLPTNWYHLNGLLADVSAASQLNFIAPRAGFLRKVMTSLGGAITGADSVITVTVDGSVLSPTITIANASSAEGDVDSAEYYVGIREGAEIEVASGGQSSTSASLAVTLTLSG